MLHYDNEFKLLPYRATFTQHGETHEQYIKSNNALDAYAELSHISDLEYHTVEYTPDHYQRLEEVKDFPASDYEAVCAYVLDGVIKSGTVLAERKEKDILFEALADLDAQREKDKQDSEVALAELAELLIGGAF